MNNQTPLVMSFVDVSPTINSGGNVTGGNRPPGTSVDTCETLVAHTLKGEAHDASEDGSGRGVPLVTSVRTAQTSANGHGISEELAHTLDGAEGQAVIIPILEAGARTGRSTEDAGCGSGIGSDGDPMFTLQSGKQHAVCFEPRYFSGREHAGGAPGKLSPALRCSHKSGDTAPTVMAFSAKDHGGDAAEDLAPTLRSGEFDKSHQNGGVMPAVAGSGTAVRRLTPVECARLQGFPDTHCHIPWKLRRIPADEARYLMGHGIECFQAESREPVAGSQPSWFTRCAPDSLIYKALGNSMAVPVMRWIGERIALVEKVLHSGSEAQQLSGFGAIPKTGAIA